MKVLFLTNYPSPYRVHFFNELGKLCDLTVVFEERPEQQIHRDPSWFCTEYIHFKPVFLKNYAVQKAKNGLPPKTVAPGIIREVKKEYDIRIVGVYSTYSAIMAILYMKKKSIPYWIETDGGMAKSGGGFQERLKRNLLSGAQKYFSPSLESDRYLLHYGAKSEDIFRYPFTSLYEKNVLSEPVSNKMKAELRKELKLTGDTIVVSVGQFIHRKGFDVLMNAATKVNEGITIYIIGGDPTNEYLELQKTLKLNKKISFVGFKKDKDLEKYYKAADFFVLPTREDIWGLVINEAMAYGLPVITTKKCVAGMELIDASNGILVDVDDEEKLAEAINELSQKHHGMAQASLERIKTYTFEMMAQRHMDVFSEVLK